jgi:phosphopantetheine--protein transferase-like protein
MIPHESIIGIGTDIVDLRRLYARDDLRRMARFILTASESKDMNKSPSAAQFLGSRLAAKESIIKSFPGTISYHDIELAKKRDKLTARLKIAEGQRYKVFLSIAHECDYAIGYAILCESKGRRGQSL